MTALQPPLELRQGENAFATSTKPAITGKLEERQSPSSHIRVEGKLAGMEAKDVMQKFKLTIGPQDKDIDWNNRLDVPGEHLERTKEVRAIILQSYRVFLYFQLLLLGLFLHAHLTEPIFDAQLMWLLALFCEFWLALAWFLEQIPKLFPVERDTFPDKLTSSCKYAGEESRLPALDCLITTADLATEDYLPMANSILSALAMEYPASKLSCYVSDENASRLSCEVLVEVSEFAKEWVPFCKKHSIQQLAPEVHLSQSLDSLKGQVDQKFIADRREVKRSYQELKMRISQLIEGEKKFLEESSLEPGLKSSLESGKIWPGTTPADHPALLQTFLGPSFELPTLVYVSRERRAWNGGGPCAQASELNALVRVSAIISNAPFLITLDARHFVKNPALLKEAMCFFLATASGESTAFVHIPLPLVDQYGSYDAVTMRALDGIQGPTANYASCCFRRQDLYGHKPPSHTTESTRSKAASFLSWATGQLSTPPPRLSVLDGSVLRLVPNLDAEGNQAVRKFVGLKGYKAHYGDSTAFIRSTFCEEGGKVPGLFEEDLAREVITVLSLEFEEDTQWGQTAGFSYGSSTRSDTLTGLTLHLKGWHSVYCEPKAAALDSLMCSSVQNAIQRSHLQGLGSLEILFSKHCPLWYGWGERKLRVLQRLHYFNIVVHPFYSIPLFLYCTLPASSLIVQKLPFSELRCWTTIYLGFFGLTHFLASILERRWSRQSMGDWLQMQQFWVLKGVSAHLLATMKCLTACFLCSKRRNQPARTARVHSTGPHNSETLAPVFALIFLTIVGSICGFGALLRGNAQYLTTFRQFIFTFGVFSLLFPLVEDVRHGKAKLSTMVILWAIVLSSAIAFSWTNVNPFANHNHGPSLRDCGIRC